jgi:hypothetical protein
MEQELTDWFGPDVHPVHAGWYHTGVDWRDPQKDDSLESKFNWWWSGKEWWDFQPGSRKDAEVCRVQNRYWRGLASDPASEVNHG